jgi:hypothetical protein
MKVRPAKAVCPVRELGPAKAREVAKNAIEAWEQDPSSEGGFSSTLELVKSE